MQNNEVSSLISLLDDSDSEIATAVMDKLCAQGEEVMPLLESAWRNASEETQFFRLEHVIAQIQEKTTLAKLKEWVQNGARDTLTGAYYATKLLRPNIEFNHIKKQISDLSREIWVELHPQLTALEQVRIINQILYGKYKFFGHRLVDSDRLMLLSDLLQSKEGSQISLSLLYCCIAEELNIPICGINLSQSAMLGYLDRHNDRGQDVFFYIDPFNGGLCSKMQLAQVVVRHTMLKKSAEHYLAPCSRQVFVHRYLRFLAELYRNTDKPNHHEKVRKGLAILSSANG
ncbi:MAG: transglutaminase-like domain-containing protein [Prevotellaceae bacterium]|jgi:regulator of sirC expression with transglutaminase-like and TPR domain|nr:transglutaminase-like domain-containing protein [Prevotellaceae bacterium]